MPIGKTLYRTLPVRLTQDELLDRSRSNAKVVETLEELEREKKRVAGDIKDRTEEATAELRRLSTIIRTGEEPRQVQCVEQRSFADREVLIYRTDTGALVEKRQMTQAEQQIAMAYEEEQANDPVLQTAIVGAVVDALRQEGIDATVDPAPTQ